MLHGEDKGCPASLASPIACPHFEIIGKDTDILQAGFLVYTHTPSTMKEATVHESADIGRASYNPSIRLASMPVLSYLEFIPRTYDS